MPTYRIDLHSHCQGDPIDDLDHDIRAHIDRAQACGLDAIALTWHQRLFDDTAAVDYAHERGVLLIPGIETELFGRKHTLVLNARPGEVSAFSTLEDLRVLSGRPDRFVLAAHPYYPHPSCLGSVIDEHPECFDGVEWCHYHFGWIPSAISPNERARRWAERNRKPLIANSDAHELASLGKFYSIVEADELTALAIFAALRAGHVRFTPQSMTMGHFVGRSFEIVRGNLADVFGGRREKAQKRHAAKSGE